jgi:hypothetical protein
VPSGRDRGARSSTRSRTARITVRISIRAKLAPMQRRGPPPKGMNVYGGRLLGRSDDHMACGGGV